MKIANKHVYITGSNRGIGFALAEKAASYQCHLHLANRSPMDEENLRTLKTAGALSVEQISLDLLNTNSINKSIIFQTRQIFI